ncbi:MAG: 30S ribosomal protein S4, partial [Holosporales bacterium]|jgi:small subunit ribosomal protein S4|nr:30S ribosomal protein S4 [Holosporales bacterium]
MKDNVNTLNSITSNERDIPDYFEIDPKGLKGKFIRPPKLEDVPYPVNMEPKLVIEFYSR